MARIKLELPETFSFRTEITVRITDLNYGGHLGNADTLVLIHEARVRFLKSYGYSEIDIEGYGTIMTDAVGCDIFYRLTNKETGAVVAVAKTGVCVFDYENQKRVSPPEAFVKKLSIA